MPPTSHPEGSILQPQRLTADHRSYIAIGAYIEKNYPDDFPTLRCTPLGDASGRITERQTPWNIYVEFIKETFTCMDPETDEDGYWKKWTRMSGNQEELFLQKVHEHYPCLAASKGDWVTAKVTSQYIASRRRRQAWKKGLRLSHPCFTPMAARQKALNSRRERRLKYMIPMDYIPPSEVPKDSPIPEDSPTIHQDAPHRNPNPNSNPNQLDSNSSKHPDPPHHIELSPNPSTSHPPATINSKDNTEKTDPSSSLPITTQEDRTFDPSSPLGSHQTIDTDGAGVKPITINAHPLPPKCSKVKCSNPAAVNERNGQRFNKLCKKCAPPKKFPVRLLQVVNHAYHNHLTQETKFGHTQYSKQ
ncbi:hypothetical protein DSL72_002697 [Monilinia vaccinii-corymbosi]|uniref:Uncharacterized protein n=1 Tax=Monilinia vaccinii-corymbosi TaxID=61207 RepID=A0A8A3PDG1_9HELO|nr:hypothetical protein DSL72_002697 [Monilinia vaccinii-corymbosi]